jgi:ABC-type transport system substrate-binding protein
MPRVNDDQGGLLMDRLTHAAHISRRSLLKAGGGALAAAAVAPHLGAGTATAQTPKRGGTLSLRLWDPPHFDPHLTISYKINVLYIGVWDGALKNYSPNLGYDWGGRVTAAWLDR